MQAPRIETQTLPPPPGIIGSLRTGFDAIAGHVAIILMPLALDLLLWLGPRLSIEQVMQSLLKGYLALATSFGMKVQDLQSLTDASGKFFQGFNMLGILRTFPIGVSSLMSGIMPTQTPMGAVSVLEAGSWLQVLGLGFLLALAGWLLGGLYFRWVAALATPDVPADARPSFGETFLQTLAYAVLWYLFMGVVCLPIGFLLEAVFLINQTIGTGVLLLLGFLSMWLVVPLFFSPHGMYVRKQNAFASILSGFQMTRYTLPTSSLFVLTILLLGVGLNAFLWSQPADNSWLMLLGIFGHAFITTALLASSFVYYDHMTSWLNIALARLHAGLPGKQA